MLKKTIVLLALSLGLSACKKDQSKPLSAEALQESLVNTDAEETVLEKVLLMNQGKTILIDVWASWCPDCINGMPKLKKLQEDFPNVSYIFLSYDKSLESWKEGIYKHNVVGQHYLLQSNWKGGGFRTAADIDWIPRYILLDKTGKVVIYRAIEADDPELITALKNLES